jgi:hypothetical protein
MTGSVGQFELEAPRAGWVLAHTFRHHACVVETRYWRGIAKEGIALSSDLHRHSLRSNVAT